MDERIRINIINLIIGLGIILWIFYPTTAVWITVIAIMTGVILLLTRNPNRDNSRGNGAGHTWEEAERRRVALREARIYLAPYTDIWSGLKLSNKLCSLSLVKFNRKGLTIVGTEILNSNGTQYFKVTNSDVHTIDELWNMFCMVFNYQTSYTGLKELCEKFNVEISEINFNNGTYSQKHNIELPKISIETSERVDINNASEVEITGLPGINIVMAKRIVQRREEIKGFKSVDELTGFLKLREHTANMLRERVCFNKMRGSIKTKLNSERSIDI
ncbi:helix-hairpin-helix domain-containing protein [bacterium]|nr:helix-hairpin-helix domain-containing protein [bacterium]MBR1776132.1 helix-hairpin-helix domain-containing protein [bacterium]